MPAEGAVRVVREDGEFLGLGRGDVVIYRNGEWINARCPSNQHPNSDNAWYCDHSCLSLVVHRDGKNLTCASHGWRRPVDQDDLKMDGEDMMPVEEK